MLTMLQPTAGSLPLRRPSHIQTPGKLPRVGGNRGRVLLGEGRTVICPALLVRS